MERALDLAMHILNDKWGQLDGKFRMSVQIVASFTATRKKNRISDSLG